MSAPKNESDTHRGLYRKFEVHRLHDLAGKHRDCSYFVLDLHHDKHAAAAIFAYATSCEEEYPELSRELIGRLATMPWKAGDFSHSAAPAAARRDVRCLPCLQIDLSAPHTCTKRDPL